MKFIEVKQHSQKGDTHEIHPLKISKTRTELEVDAIKMGYCFRFYCSQISPEQQAHHCTSNTKMKVKTTDIVAKGTVTGSSTSHCNQSTSYCSIHQADFSLSAPHLSTHTKFYVY